MIVRDLVIIALLSTSPGSGLRTLTLLAWVLVLAIDFVEARELAKHRKQLQREIRQMEEKL